MTKISALPAGAATDGTERIAAVQNGVTVRLTASQLTGTVPGHATLDLALTGGTMSGDIAMGGHQINNVIVGNVSPLPGSFTNLFASNATITTINGYALAGTIAGGGNQINDVIIGNVSPHAAGFTNVAANTVEVGTNAAIPNGVIFTVSNNTGFTIPAMSGFAPQAVIVGADNTRGELAIQSYGNGVGGSGESTILLFGARGTMAGTAASKQTKSGDLVGELGFHPHDGVDFVHNAGAVLIGALTEDTTPGNAGQELRVYTTPNTTATAAQAAVFQHSGGFSVGTGTDLGAGGILANTSIKSQGATGGIGYATGAGGTGTQASSKSTTTTLSPSACICGQVTMNAAALAAATIVSFTLTNTAIAATDVLILNHISGGTVGAYTLNAQAAAGSATINVRNNTAGSLSEAIVIQFAVIKAVNA